jgi:hypothetical protein
MDEKAQSLDSAAEQAVHDRSVIDYVIHAFSSGNRDQSPRAPTSEHSAAIYHQIRRTWPDEWWRPAATMTLIR